MSYDEDVPESMFGSIAAFEGIADAQTIINGPTGCKYPPAAKSEDLFLRSSYDPYEYMDRFYFSQPRVPCTYMDSDDLILGTDEKLKEISNRILEQKVGLLGLINSPGAALIGSKLDVVDNKGIPVVSMEGPGYSESFDDGFKNTIIAVLEKVCTRKEKKRMTVNVIGLSINEVSWKDDIDEIRSLLSDCGITVIAFIGAGCTVEEIRKSPSAELNIVLHRNLGDRIAEWYEDRFSIPYIDAGLPLGFDAIDNWIDSICNRMKADKTAASKRILEARRWTANEIDHINKYTRIPAGYTFSICANGPLTYHITKMLYEYLGMLPVAVKANDSSYDDEILGLLTDIGSDVTDDVFDTEADIFLGSANLASDLLFRDMVGGAVNIETPRMSRVYIKKRPLLGIEGTKVIIDEVMNSISSI